mmetsp:Transcript_7909/g.13269  ORF Transcript_7909/g.13269 Transcript_7909/m.13269 type:complete len:158 (-) Transcript_7909:904-1377(-)
MVTGFIVAGFGFGAFIYSFITTSIVNPRDVDKLVDEDGNKTYYPKYIADKVPHMYDVCIESWAVLALVGVLLIQRNPDYVAKEAQFERQKLIQRSIKQRQELLAKQEQLAEKALKEEGQVQGERINFSQIESHASYQNSFEGQGTTPEHQRRSMKFN